MKTIQLIEFYMKLTDTITPIARWIETLDSMLIPYNISCYYSNKKRSTFTLCSFGFIQRPFIDKPSIWLWLRKHVLVV